MDTEKRVTMCVIVKGGKELNLMCSEKPVGESVEILVKIEIVNVVNDGPTIVDSHLQFEIPPAG